jgi:hypothetical protein
MLNQLFLRSNISALGLHSKRPLVLQLALSESEGSLPARIGAATNQGVLPCLKSRNPL